MKTLISYVAFAALVLMSSFTIDTQQKLNQEKHQAAPSSCFNYFRIHRQAQGVAMTWATSATDIVSFVVEKSYDDYYYESAGAVNTSNHGSYKFVDTNVYPGYVYYRIMAIKSDGSVECSPVESVRIVKRN
jgi:hypothetical protein